MYAIERTLKTSRILVRSDFQAVIFSLSFFAWRCRETTFRLPCLTIPVWIAATALRSERKYRELVTQSVHRNWFSPRRQLLDCLAHGVIEVVQPLPTQSPVEGGADVSAGQPKFDVIHLVCHLFLGAFQTAIDRRIPGDSP